MQIRRQLPNTRARMVRGIVANEAQDGSTPFARSNSPYPVGPVDGPFGRRRWFESNSGRQTRAERIGGDFLRLQLSVRV